MAITSIGVGSGLDVESIITQMVALEKSRLSPLQSQASLITSRISTVGQIKSLTSTLQEKLKVLSDSNNWATAMVAKSSSESVLSASIGAEPTPGNYSISVSQMATPQSMTSGRFTTGHAFDTDGVLSIDGVNVQIAAGSSLQSVVKSINASEANVTATILNDGVGQRLVLTSKETGSSNAFTLTASGGVQSLDASRIAQSKVPNPDPDADPAIPYEDPDASAQGVIVAATDALATINGVAVTSSSNVFKDTIQGVSFSALTTGASTLTVSSDAETLQKRVKEFVDAYNALNTALATSTRYDSASNTAGYFQADSSIVSLQNGLRNAFSPSATVTGISGSAFKKLADLGLEMKTGGAISINEDKLKKVLQENSKEVGDFFSEGSVGVADKLYAYTRGILGSEGVLETKLTALNSASKRNTAEQDKVNDRASIVEARLRTQYTALDTKMSSLNALSSYVTQQVTQWNKSSD